MHKMGIINSKTLLVGIFMEIQPSTCLPEPHSPTEGGDSPLVQPMLARAPELEWPIIWLFVAVRGRECPCAHDERFVACGTRLQ